MSATHLRTLWHRRIWLACGCTLPCLCDWKAHPSAQLVDAYAQAIADLNRLGYPAAPLRPELDALARRGGAEAALAKAVERRWTA